MTDTTNLRTLAQAATPGPWMYRSDGVVVRVAHSTGEQKEQVTSRLGALSADAAFIAAVDPSTVLALLDERDRLETAIREALAVMDRSMYGNSEVPFEMRAPLSAALGGE